MKDPGRSNFARGALACIFIAAMPALAQDVPPDPPESSTFSVVPAQPTTRHAISIRNVFTGCRQHGPIRAQEIRVDIAAGIIDYLIPYGNDEAGCEPSNYLENAFGDSTVGQLPAGAYTVRFFSCGMQFDPEATCNLMADPRLQLVVTEAGARHVIPASSPWARVTLLGAIACLAAWWLRRR